MDSTAIAAAFLDLLRHPTSAGAIFFVAIVVGGLVRVVRSDTISNWLDNTKAPWIKRLPRWSLPWIALVLGAILNVLNAKLNAHLSWSDSFSAALAGIIAGWVSVGGHQTVGKIIGALVYKPIGPLTPPQPTVGADIPPALAAHGAPNSFGGSLLTVAGELSASSGTTEPPERTREIAHAAIDSEPPAGPK